MCYFIQGHHGKPRSFIPDFINNWRTEEVFNFLKGLVVDKKVYFFNTSRMQGRDRRPLYRLDLSIHEQKYALPIHRTLHCWLVCLTFFLYVGNF